MHNWILFSVLLSLLLLASIVAIYPFRKSKGIALLVLCCFLSTASFFYYRYGAFYALKDYQSNQLRAERARALLASIHSPEELIEKLKEKIATDSQNPQGWYLLAKIYASQGKMQEADLAFTKAKELEAKP